MTTNFFGYTAPLEWSNIATSYVSYLEFIILHSRKFKMFLKFSKKVMVSENIFMKYIVFFMLRKLHWVSESAIQYVKYDLLIISYYEQI